ncbi:MAG: alpha/beta hydrolase [Roseibium sp.]|nr:alpha/beta hydrolase [Roseibium sp.]
MKIADTDILLVPGQGDTPDGHWMKRWQAKMANAWVVEQLNWHQPVRKVWQDALVARVELANRPVVLVGHSLGCILIAHAGHVLPKGTVRGAYLVAPTDLERNAPKPVFDVAGFAPLPAAPLPFRTHLVASRTDPQCAFERAAEFAKSWGATFQDAGDAGHLNLASGHGPWPEGMMSFAAFMKRLG